MKRTLILSLLLTVSLASNMITSRAMRQTAQVDTSHVVFWQKFRDAVIKGNKPLTADMAKFPVSMPYGHSTVKNRAQLIRRYREVFNHEGSAAKCFVAAKPVIERERPNEFTVGCKNAAGDEVVIYSFTRGAGGWKFTGLDNLNE